MINLLPWRENLRRKRRRKIVLRVGIFFAVLMVLAMIGRGCVESRLKNAQRELSEISRELEILKKEFDLRNLLWLDQKKVVSEWEEQQSWRKKFSCQKKWLNELAFQLPTLCRVEKTEVNDERWRLETICQEEVGLRVLVQSILALPGLSQVSISQLEIDEKEKVFRLESRAVLRCE